MKTGSKLTLACTLLLILAIFTGCEKEASAPAGRADESRRELTVNGSVSDDPYNPNTAYEYVLYDPQGGEAGTFQIIRTEKDGLAEVRVLLNEYVGSTMTRETVFQADILTDTRQHYADLNDIRKGTSSITYPVNESSTGEHIYARQLAGRTGYMVQVMERDRVVATGRIE